MVLDPGECFAEADEVPAALADRGLALLDGLTDSACLLRLAHSIATVVPHWDSGPDGVTIISDLGREFVRRSFAGFSALALNPHTDRSGVSNPPGLLLTSCGQPAEIGGECVVVDGQAVYDDLAQSDPDALRAFRNPRSVLFGGAAGYLGSIFTDIEDGRVAIRLRLDELAQFSPEVSCWLPSLLDAIDRHAVTFTLHPGQGYILDNHRWLHGRRAFLGQRVHYRILGDSLSHLGIPRGFRASHQFSPCTAGLR
jgi:alpha-ketoglutarate-dependent taurine dioxygenase